MQFIFYKQKTTKEFILKLLRENPNMTRDDLSKQIGVSANVIKQHLANSQKESKLKRVGGRKAGYWEVKNFKY